MLNNCLNPHIGFLIHRLRAVMVGKSKWKPYGAIPNNIVNSKQHNIPEIGATIKDVSSIVVMVPNTSPFNLLIWPMTTSAS